MAGLELTTSDTQQVVSGLLQNQILILVSIRKRIDSILANLKSLLQADLFDHELDAARHLANVGHLRAAGAMAGVVLESHLSEVCDSHELKLGRKQRNLSNLNDALKGADVIDVPIWRNIQGLTDIRNLCDHKKQREPAAEEIQRLIDGTDRFLKELH